MLLILFTSELNDKSVIVSITKKNRYARRSEGLNHKHSEKCVFIYSSILHSFRRQFIFLYILVLIWLNWYCDINFERDNVLYLKLNNKCQCLITRNNNWKYLQIFELFHYLNRRGKSILYSFTIQLHIPFKQTKKITIIDFLPLQLFVFGINLYKLVGFSGGRRGRGELHQPGSGWTDYGVCRDDVRNPQIPPGTSFLGGTTRLYVRS